MDQLVAMRQAMNINHWAKTKSGELALMGSTLRVVYDPHPHGDFHLIDEHPRGTISLHRYHTLANAKNEAEARKRELDEIL